LSEDKSVETIRKISFPLFPYKWETINQKNEYLVEKADTGGKKRRYIVGIATGMQIDKHGERLTKNAVHSIINQCNSGDLLLYNDIHGIRDNEDIGILDKAEILPDGDLKTDFRLYDQYDNLGEEIVKSNDKLWRKMNGLPPYTKRRQKGFSIEGYVPENKIIAMDEKGGRRVIDDVLLDGVVLVPRPAYNSITEAVCKCLGELTPKIEEKVKKSFNSKLSELINQKEISNQYFNKKYDIEQALEDAIKEIMSDKFENKGERLIIIFDEYKSMMIGLIINSSSLFPSEDSEDDTVIERSEKIKQLLTKAEFNCNSLLEKIRRKDYGK
jgi:hypothetical protein